MSLGGVGFYGLTTTVAPGAGTKIGASEVIIDGQKVYFQGVVVGYLDNIGGFVPVDSTKPLPVVLSNPLLPNKYNYIKATYPTSLTEVYTYRDGGATGTVVATIEVSFLDTAKEIFDTLFRY